MVFGIPAVHGAVRTSHKVLAATLGLQFEGLRALLSGSCSCPALAQCTSEHLSVWALRRSMQTSVYNCASWTMRKGSGCSP